MTATTRSRRGRPRRADAQALERRILDAAWQTFLETGFETATMEILARRAGVMRNTLYARYTDKLGLLRATVADRIARWSRASAAVTARRPIEMQDLEGRLIAFATTALQWAGHPEVLATARLVRGASAEARAIARELDLTIRNSGLQAIAAMIEEDATRSGHRIGDAMTIARLLIGMLEAFAPVEDRATLTREQAEAIARKAVAVLLRGREAW
ncbi:MAG: TetR/AcrR family transcriptional regulator [Novosphingobium sp.]|nr:TetR/AcrR family transcriptional regulator [Novosphingobium sp.]